MGNEPVTMKRFLTFPKILVWSCVALFSAILLWNAFEDEITQSEKDVRSTSTTHLAILPSIPESPKWADEDKDILLDPKNQEWCDTSADGNLAKHPVFQQFSNWQVTFEGAKNTPATSVPKENLLSDGEDLSRVRARVLRDLIRIDPKSALMHSVSPESVQTLPETIRQNMEVWHSAQADFKAVHVCFNPKNPKGRIHRWVTMPDGESYTAFVYGKRAFMPTLENVVISGISLGDVMAVSEDAYRLVGETAQGKFSIEYAGRKIAVSKDEGMEALDRRIREADLLALRDKRFRSPLMASSTGETHLTAVRYELVTTPMTWADANQTAGQKKGRLVCINNATENNIVYQLLKDAVAMGLLPDGSGVVQYSWIGATDSEDQNGSYLDKDANETKELALSATEGDWYWLSGEDISASLYSNWKDDVEPNNLTKDYGAMDWSTTDGKWVDLNGSDSSYRLPFVIEYDIDLTPSPTSHINGKRKVLIIPARFRDEGNNFDGSSSNSNDPFGNPTTSGQSNDAFEPDTRENLIRVMNQVKEFYLRNSDGTFQMDAVITPTVTMDLPKWKRVAAGTADAVDNRIFDSTGLTYWSEEVDYGDGKEIAIVGEAAKLKAAQISRLYEYDGAAFQGVISIDVNASFGSFALPPLVELRGGDVNVTSGIYDPDFVAAQAKALVNSSGQVTQIVVTDPGAFYHSTPTLFLDNVDYNSSVAIKLDRTIVSWAAVTTTGSGGLGMVGGPGSHVNAPADAGVMAHELGHNFGLWHSNKYISYGLRPNSDEGENIDYGNPYSLMGGGGITGDLTISSKVFLWDMGHFGLKGGTGENNATDVAHLFGENVVETSGLREANATNPNTFRIYRHDYGSAPYPLRTGLFTVSIPSSILPPGLAGKLPLSVLIGGPGEGATGFLESNGTGMQLNLTAGGKGFSEDPLVHVLDSDNQTVLLTLSSSWIVERSGTSSVAYEQAMLRNFATTAQRGLRGVEIPASEYTPLGPDAETPSGSYWVSYRRSANEYGLSVINGTTKDFGTSENALIDTTSFTQGDFDDAFLRLGRTFSDYESDAHVTPVRKGGTPPMEYIEAVVNVGTVGKGLAGAPEFTVQVSDSTPSIDQQVDMTVIPTDGNASAYAYSWYQNELPLDDIRYMNQRTISQKFSSAGQHVLKVVVSDMKGGISSENVVIRVGDAKSLGTTLVSGQVRSPKGPVQGAKVLISKTPIIEHTVSVSGSLQDSRIPSHSSTPLHYVIDNVANKQLLLHRGEIHRFYFDPSTDGNPLSFFEHPDHEPAQVKLNLLLTPLIEFPGSGYKEPPQVDLVGGSLYDSAFSEIVTTLYDYQQDFANQPNVSTRTLITLPTAKSLLNDTNVTQITVRPISSDPTTGLYLHYGGTGHDRDNTPDVSVKRSSYWENYNEANASAIAYVDGVGTITVDDVGAGYPTTPKIVVFGAGQDANVTATIKNSTNNQRKSSILENSVSISDQGWAFDPNSTLAIAQYPLDPLVYYSFDQTESLFENNTRYKPTSGFNNRISSGLKHHWQMNDVNASAFENNVSTSDLTINAIADPSIRSKWGLKRKAIELQPGDTMSQNTIFSTSGATFSFWVYLNTTGGPVLNLVAPTGLTIGPGSITFGAGLTGPATGEWAHVLLADDGSEVKVYLNGTELGSRNVSFATNLQLTGNDCLIDELMVYDRALTPTEIKQMAGRIFLDLSGNKYHAVPMGPGFDMTDGDPAGLGDGLGDSQSTDLGQGLDLNGSQYLDLVTNQKALSALDKGTIAFWAKPSNASEMTILSAADLDKNNTYYRLFIRDNGTIRQELLNDGSELCKVSSDASVDLSNGAWHHVAVLVDDTGVQFYIDGKSVASVVPAGASNDRAFFTDLDKISHFAVGLHQTSESNATNYFNGEMDEVHIYNRALTNAEINYLYDLGNDGKVQRARLSPSVDAIGTVMVTTPGAGYKEQPEVVFDYTTTGVAHPGEQAVGRAELFPVGVEQILLTKDFYEPVQITLPDGRAVSRRHLEYVLRVKPAPSSAYDAQPAMGIFGYSAPPDIVVEGTPTWPDDFNATAYPLMFLDPNASVEIVNGGQGYDLSQAGNRGFDADAVRIFGEGYRPPEFEAFIYGGEVASLVLKKAGEGNFTADGSKVYFLGEDGNAIDPSIDAAFINGSLVRRNTFSEKAADNLYDVNGINFQANGNGSGWTTPPTVFADWGNTGWGGHVGVTDLEFNATLSEVIVQNPGFRYSVPAKVNLFGGQLFDSNASAVFRPAVVEINGTDVDGGITSYRIVDGGTGYIREPIVSITGGGGVGATAIAFVNIFDGNVTGIFPIEPGRGYHNLDANNVPAAKLSFNHVLGAAERNASVVLRLGGNLNKPTIVKNNDDPQYITPWVEIYDRGRANVPEADRAEAVAKVKDGNITKIIVTKSGRGYVDPIVAVRGSPPKLAPYFDPNNNTKRLWQCTHVREDTNGSLHGCGHIHEGDNPPASCPGETPPGPKQTTSAANNNWWTKHAATCRNHASHAGTTNHNSMGFKVRSCGGIPAEFVLINDPYRFPRTDWLPYDVNCSAIVLDGMIREIVVENNGTRYISPHLEFKGTGGEVDAVPVFDEQGYLVDVFFDDPRIKNLEIDKIDRPLGAGQGFTERPWTKDANYDAVYGPRELITFEVHSDMAFAGEIIDLLFGIPAILLPQTSHVYTTVLPRDSWGDRVVDIEVLDVGLFAEGTQATVQVDFDFNSSFYSDGVPATAIARFTNRLTRMELDHNGTHSWNNYPTADGNKKTVTRSTFLAEPKVTIFNEFYDDFFGLQFKRPYSFFLDENKTSQVRLNGVVDYDVASERSYLDLVVDERLPNKFYYGLADSNRSAMGGEILIGEGMHYANWGSTEQWGAVAYTDADGFYAVSGLDPGFYNVAVVMEDERYQEMTFRPDSNMSLVSKTIHIPGFSSLSLETDRRGLGKSRLIWSSESRARGRTATPQTPPDTFKVLEGIGGGFVTGQPIHLAFDPHPANTSRAVPKIDYNVSVDGTLKLTIVDDQNSSVFDPEDRFSLRYASPINITGIDFTEDFRFDDVNQSFWGGSQSVAGKRQLIISPNAGGEANFFEAPIASSGDPNATTSFSIKGYDQNGTGVTPLTANWSLVFDYSPTDGNYTKIASLDTNQSDQVTLTLRSALRDGNATLRASTLINGVETNASVKLIAFQRVPLTDREVWMDQYFDTVLESAVDWNADHDLDSLTNQTEWTYRTNPFLSDTDGDGLADVVEINATKTSPRSSDTDGDGFSDKLEVDVSALNPLAYDLAPPDPEFTYDSNLSTITAYAGSKILLGAIVKEYALDGSGNLVPLTVAMSGSYSQVVSSSNGEWLVSETASPGTYTVVYSVNDSLNRSFSQTQYLVILARDVTPPVITLSDAGPIYVLKGNPFTLPSYSAYDETDTSLTVTVSGDSAIDANKTGTYNVTYSVTDQAGNPASVVLQVVVENYAYSIAGKAIDGYLVGSTVIFDAFKNGVLDGVHDLASPVTTDGSGQFVLSLTTPELELFDTDKNGKIDSNEGRIVVTGGFDVTTNAPFTGSYSADANSTVVSPLSTLVTAVMDEGAGMTKEMAKAKVVEALGLPATVDPTNYDPLAAASGGDATSAKVLLETARLANMMKQADSFAEYRGVPFTSAGQAGTNFISQLADDIGAWNQGDPSPLDNDTLIKQSLVSALQAIQPGATDTDADEAVQLMRTSDTLLVQTAASGSGVNVLAVSLAKNQQAISSEVIDGYDNLTSSGNAISTLSISQQTLQTVSDAIASINVFPPTASPFTSSVRAGDWTSGNQITILSAADADGDQITYSITSSNFDLDGDGTPPFTVSASGALSISDTDDLTPYAASTMEIKVSLSDGKGMSSTVEGSIQVDNLLSLSSTPVSGKTGWASSSWLGNFYSAGSSWVYNASMGWLFVSPDNAGGYWLWDSVLEIWWWTKPDVFPHFYRNDTGWSYWSLSGNSRLYYNYTTKSWVSL